MKKIFGFLFGALFLWGCYLVFSSLQNPGNAGNRDEVPGVVLTPQPGFYVIDIETDKEAGMRKTGLRVLEAFRREHPTETKICLNFKQTSGKIYLHFDFENEIIEELAANAYGAVTQRIWRSGIEQRIEWFKQSGNFTPDGFSQPVSRNLYH